MGEPPRGNGNHNQQGIMGDLGDDIVVGFESDGTLDFSKVNLRFLVGKSHL